MKFSTLFIISVLTTSSAFGLDFNIKEYGAVSDKSVNSTDAIQKAITACAKNGGGTVVFPSGEYLSGSVYLEDNVILHLESGATWYGSCDTSLYPVHIPEFVSMRRKATALIYAEQKSNIGITGFGTINGQGDKEPFHVTWSQQGAPVKRPKLLSFVECRDVHISDVRFENSPKWTLSFLACENLFIDGVTISTKRSSVNNDGIDLDGCKKAVISNCIIDSEDDAIVLKSTSGRFSEDITIANCVLSSHCNAFKCGTESNTGFKNIVFTNSVIRDTYLSGIALEIVDGGLIDGIMVSNITMNSVNNPLFIKLGDRGRKYRDDMERPSVGQVRNITISNIIANNVGGFVEGPAIEFSHKNANPMAAACQVSGLQDNYIENVSIRDMKIVYNGGGAKGDRTITVPERPGTYPEYSAYGSLPSYGFFCRHVKNLNLRNIEISTLSKDERYAFVLDDIQTGGLEQIHIINGAIEESIKIENSSRLKLELHHLMLQDKTVIQKESKGILIN